MERIEKELHTEFYDYYGETLNDLPDGKGHMDYLGDDYFFTYDGEFKQGKEHGHGRQVCLDGTFDCDFVEGQAKGYGKVYWPEGDVYEGEIDVMPEGLGKLTYVNGDVYEGEFKNGFPDGKGTMTYYDGSVVKGVFLERNCLEEEIK